MRVGIRQMRLASSDPIVSPGYHLDAEESKKQKKDIHE